MITNHIEKSYGKVARKIMNLINPVKKRIIKTYCTVHKYININAINILKNNGYEQEYKFYKKYLKNLNNGVVFADQNFKSSNHFYNVNTGKGLYGFSNALLECKKYYNKAIYYLNIKNINMSIFYLGAACHLIQDSTVPYHVNNKLLKNHRKFEVWIISRLLNDYSFRECKEIKRFDSIEKYIKNNAIIADKIYKKYFEIKDVNLKFEKISNIIIKEAEKTTAGFLLDYYEIYKNNM